MQARRAGLDQPGGFIRSNVQALDLGVEEEQWEDGQALESMGRRDEDDQGTEATASSPVLLEIQQPKISQVDMQMSTSPIYAIHKANHQAHQCHDHHLSASDAATAGAPYGPANMMTQKTRLATLHDPHVATQLCSNGECGDGHHHC